MPLRFSEASTIEIFQTKASKLLKIRYLHAFLHEFIESNTKPYIDSFNNLKGSRALNDDWLLHDISKSLCKLKHIVCCEH